MQTPDKPASQPNRDKRWHPPEQFGNYILESEIDSGGMGIIYKGYRLPEKKAVAIKFMLEQSQYKRFQREASTGLKLHHRNFVRFHDSGEIEGHFYIVMDFINGEPLKKYLEKVNLNSDQRLALFHKIVCAICYAHNEGIIHRDLKPANILIDTENEPVILDFGLAKCLEFSHEDEQTALTIAGQILGTPGYMSPEQARGEIDNQDERSDIFCLGIILYEMITARNPFEGANFLEICYNIAHKAPTPIDKIIAGIPPQLANICNQALARNKSDRYQTARDLADDVLNYLNLRKKNEQATISYSAPPVTLPQTPASPMLPVIPEATGNEVPKPAGGQRKLSKIVCTSCGALNDPGTANCSKCSNVMRKIPALSKPMVAQPQSQPTPAVQPMAAPAKVFNKKKVDHKLSLAMPIHATPHAIARQPIAVPVTEKKNKKPYWQFIIGSLSMALAMIPVAKAFAIPYYGCVVDLLAGVAAEAMLQRHQGNAWMGSLIFAVMGLIGQIVKYLLLIAPFPFLSTLMSHTLMGVALTLLLGCTMGLAKKRFQERMPFN
jgi:serine/threonine-protein kinase